MQYRSTEIRRGMTVLEMTVALTILAVGLALTAQVFTACAHQHLAGEQLQVAQWEAANVLEHFAGLRYEEVTSAAAQTIQPSSQLHATLPTAKLRITVTDSDVLAEENPANAVPPHKHIRVEVAWPTPEGSLQSVSLCAWKFPTAPAAAKSAPEAAP
ncbi:MAG TPA: prepilin-type N-terminal cleavage/methylation domain-containing protein [Pirellulales bacterium]|jgi:prepilin-type N-terminal cleavage/methylation domain-containing protein